MNPTELKDALLSAFPDADIEIKDLTGTQDHYQARIVAEGCSPARSRIEQHRLVYAALGDAMRGPVHALALNTYSPEAWRSKKP